MAFIDRNANVAVARMPQIRHMKTIFRAGLNAASGSVPAGTRVKIVQVPGPRKGRR